MRLLLVPAIFTILVTACLADEVQIQKHDPKKCGSNQGCLHLWYDEYKKEITGEVLFWRQFENDASNQDSQAANEDLNKAMKEKQYRHYSWDFPRNTQIEGISDADLNALTWDCRTAITEMKYWLIGLQKDGYDKQDDDRRSYLEKVHICEHHMHLPDFDSDLR